MKKRVYPILIAFGLFVACAKSPSACFKLSHDNPFKVNEEIKFDGSCSTNTNYYQWFYKDGSFSKISNDPTAVHSFTAPGTYSVKLKAEGKNSAESNTEMNVIVEQ